MLILNYIDVNPDAMWSTMHEALESVYSGNVTRFSLDDLQTAINDPYFIQQELNAAIHRRGYRWDYNERGVDIFSEDWDNLIILDACRVDAYEEHALPELPSGKLETRESRGAATPEFIRGNFTDRTLHDTVYVTGSSWIFKIGDEIDTELFALVDAKNDLDENQEYQLEKALTANETYPNKRLIIHFIPPHHPFMGDLAEEYLPPVEEQTSEFFGRLRRNEFDLSQDLLWKIYLENLDRVLPHVETLIDELEGRTVVTADHAELFGNRVGPIPMDGWAHPRGLYDEQLVTVPWHVHDSEKRKTIKAEEPEDDHLDSRDPDEIDEHLRALGYKV